MNRIGCHRRGFTLIELLIVVGIVVTISGTVYGTLTHLSQGQARLQARMDAREGTRRALTQWREDVACARRIDAGTGGAALTLIRPAAAGGMVTVVYALTPQGALERRAAPGETRTLARGIAALQFEARAGAWRMACTAQYDDGLTRWQWPAEGWAAPLTAGEAVQ